ncbi:MAG: FMN-binding protein [Methylophilaceae bacterium]
MMKTILMGLALLISSLASNVYADVQYLTPEQFLTEAFAAGAPKPELLWLTKDIAQQSEKILGHAPMQLRQRYWRIGDKSVWIFDEIGKEEPITAGFVISAGKISQVRVLTYRESRGWEVRYPAFLKQYQGIELQPDNYLSRNIDGISGATLSVNAMNRMARLALYFERVSRMGVQ